MSDVRATWCAEKPWAIAAAAAGVPAQVAGSPRPTEGGPGVVEDVRASVAAEDRDDATWRAAPGRRGLRADCRNGAYGTTILRVDQGARAPDIAPRSDLMDTGCAVFDGAVVELTRKARWQQAGMGL